MIVEDVSNPCTILRSCSVMICTSLQLYSTSLRSVCYRNLSLLIPLQVAWVGGVDGWVMGDAIPPQYYNRWAELPALTPTIYWLKIKKTIKTEIGLVLSEEISSTSSVHSTKYHIFICQCYKDFFFQYPETE